MVSLPDAMQFLDYGFRIYNPRLGRWDSPDPLAELFGSQTPFGYANNSPINFIDMFGLFSQGPNWLPPVTITAPGGGGGLDFFGMSIFQNWQEQVSLQRTEEPLPYGSYLNPVLLPPVVVTALRPKLSNDWQYGIPVWGSARLASDYFASGEYFDGVGWFCLGVAELASLTALSYGIQGARMAAISSMRTGAISTTIRTEAQGVAKTVVGRSGNILSPVAKNSPAIIYGRKFTGHALDQMQARGIISPRVVLNVVNNPTTIMAGNRPGTMVYVRENLKVVTNSSGDIMTVMWQ